MARFDPQVAHTYDYSGTTSERLRSPDWRAVGEDFDRAKRLVETDSTE